MNIVNQGSCILISSKIYIFLSYFSRIGPPSSPTGGEKEENPALLAENCFRELLGRATYGNMNNAVRPVFA